MRARSLLMWLLPAACLALAGCGDGDSTSSSSGSSSPSPAAASASAGSPAAGGMSAGALPGQMFPSQGNAHLSFPNEQHPAYNSNPPSSGPHLPDLPRPGTYEQPHSRESLPHFMEHGGVWLLYNCPEGCANDVAELNKIVNAAIDRSRPAAVAPFPGMPSRFAVVAWEYLLAMDALDRAKVEEFVSRLACNYNPEGGPYCPEKRGELKP